MKIKKCFVRLSSAALPEETALPSGWFVISWRHIEDMKERRWKHGKWCTISSEHSKIFRVIRFSGSLKSADDQPSQMILDYVGWLTLSGNDKDVNKPLNLEITDAKWHEYPRLAVSHPDPSFRLASWIALLSLALGVLSIVLAILPYLAKK